MRKGRFGEFGGQYITETLMNELIGLEKSYEEAMKDEKFRETPIPSSNPEKNLDLINLQTIFKGYLTDARAMGILSKTPERRRIDKLVREFINDAREDFIRDHGEELAQFDDKFKKHVFNAGAEPFLKIKKAIAFESEGQL